MAGNGSMKVLLFLTICTIIALAAEIPTKAKPNPDKPRTRPDGVDVEKRFRMNKMNLLWEKAKKRVAPADLVELYGEMRVLDQEEVEYKKRKAEGFDDDGDQEALIRDKFLNLVAQYNLRTEAESRRSNSVAGENETVEKDLPTFDGDKQMDKRLGKIWTKAQSAGFSDEELEQLREEFLHHQQKLEEFNELRNEVDGLAGESSIDNNLTELKDGLDPAVIKEKKEQMKQKWREIKDGYTTLENNFRVGGSNVSDFTEPKVAELWSIAQKANFTEIELESFKEELKHFEHKVVKHLYLKKELESTNMRKEQNPDSAADPDDKIVKMEQKVQEHGKKVKKIHTELRSRIKENMRAEL